MSQHKETTGHTLLVAFVLCIVCSVVVAGAAVALKPAQTSNKQLDRQKNILSAAGLLDGPMSKADIEAQFSRFEARLVDLDSGNYVSETDNGVQPEDFDQKKASKDPGQSIDLDGDTDIAGIGRRENLAQVYILKDGVNVSKIVLPIRGYGLWSTLWGYLVLEGDGNTVAGLAYYDQQETPGLGGEVDNPAWKAQWPGKRVFNDAGAVAIHLKKGGVDPASQDAQYQVDALSGATLTSKGVDYMLQFWLGENGFGPYLQKVRGGQA